MSNIKLDITMIKKYKEELSEDKSLFENVSFSTFKSSYINNCRDTQVKKLADNLFNKYNTILEGYNNIEIWWDNYIKTYENLENQNKKIMSNSILNNIYHLDKLTGESKGLNYGALTNSYFDSKEQYSNNSSSSEITELITEISELDKNLTEENQDYVNIKNTLSDNVDFAISGASTVIVGTQSVMTGVASFFKDIANVGAMIGGGFSTVFIKPFNPEKNNEIQQGISEYIAYDRAELEKDTLGWGEEEISTTGNPASDFIKSIGHFAYENAWGGNKDWTENTRAVGGAIGGLIPNVVISVLTLGTGTAATTVASTSSKIATTATKSTQLLSASSKSMAITGGLSGFGSGASEAANSGANYEEMMLSGIQKGAWQALEYGGGTKLGLSTISKNPAINVVSKTLGESILSAGGAFVDPLIKSNYMDGSYTEIFDASGGWDTVATSAAVGAGFGFLGEISGLFKFMQTSNNAENGILSSTINLNNIDNIELKIDNLFDNPKVEEVLNYGILNKNIKIPETINILNPKTNKEINFNVEGLVKILGNESTLNNIIYSFPSTNNMLKNVSQYDFAKGLVEANNMLKNNNYYISINKEKISLLESIIKKFESNYNIQNPVPAVAVTDNSSNVLENLHKRYSIVNPLTKESIKFNTANILEISQNANELKKLIYSYKDNKQLFEGLSQYEYSKAIIEFKNYLEKNHNTKVNINNDLLQVLDNIVKKAEAVNISVPLKNTYITDNKKKYYDWTRDNLIPGFERYISNLVSKDKINEILDIMKLQNNSEYLLKGTVNSLGYSNGKVAVINIEKIPEAVKSVIAHESIHHLSNKKISNSLKYSGFRIDEYDYNLGEWKNTGVGFNEASTELLTKIFAGKDHYKIDYEYMTERLNKIINLNIPNLNIDTFAQAYFSNNNNVMRNIINTYTGNSKFYDQLLIPSFDEALNKKNFASLDAIITYLENLSKK